MSRKKTYDEFIHEMKIKHPDIDVLSKEYNGAHNKVLCKCSIDGYEWETVPHSLLKGNGCPRCAGKERYTNCDFINAMNDINSNIEILSEYKGTDKKIKCRCKIDGYEWNAIPHHLLEGYGCHRCGGVERKDTLKFSKELLEINPDIQVLGEYVGNKTKILCKCLIDGTFWEATPNSLLRGRGCPHCRQSKGEKSISDYLSKHNICFLPQFCFENCKNVRNLPFDFYIPTSNILIEYDGEQHFSPVMFGGHNDKNAIERFEKTKINDSIKTQYCKIHNIKLIRIHYTDFNNIEEILDKQWL